MKLPLLVFSCASLLAFMACNNQSGSTTVTTEKDSVPKPQPARAEENPFRKSINGKQVELFFLKNKNEVKAAITNYGGRLVSLWVPDKNGKLTDVILGYDSLALYQEPDDPYFRALR
jgi:aldose 1-epimerase